MTRLIIFLITLIIIGNKNAYAGIGDQYFCNDIRFSIFQDSEFRIHTNYSFFLDWSPKLIKVKYTGGDYTRTSEIIVQDEVSFLAYKSDEIDNSGWTTYSFNEANENKIIALRSHQDKDFVSNVISECFKK